MESCIIKLLLVNLVIVASFVAAQEKTDNIQATTSIRSILKSSQKYNENHVWNISPASGVSSSHFLEIYWHFFSVHGTMPECDNDYVEVFLTKSNHSAGRFCSNNIGQYKPFPMYSVDGYARIHFHSDSVDIGAGFFLSYWLLNTSKLSQNCVNTDNKLRSGFMFSPGWPFSYAQASVPCIHNITTGANRETKLLFIDLDLNHKDAVPSCNSDDDYIEIRGTNSSSPSFKTSSVISGKICRAATTKVVVTRSKYIYVQFNRKIGPQSTSRRGYFLGYISYDIVANAKGTTATTATTTTKKSATTTITTTLTTDAATNATTSKSTTKSITKATTVTKHPTTKRTSTSSRMTPIKETITKGMEKGETHGGGENEKIFMNSTIGLAVVSFLLFLICLVVTIFRRKPAMLGGPPAPQGDFEGEDLQGARRGPIAAQGEPQAAQINQANNADYEEIGPREREGDQPYLEPQNVPRRDGMRSHTAIHNNNRQAIGSIRGRQQPTPHGQQVDEERNELVSHNERVRFINKYDNVVILDNNPSNLDRNHQRAASSSTYQNAQAEIAFKGPGRSNRGFSQ